MRAYERNSRFRPKYPDLFNSIWAYLEEHGTINISISISRLEQEYFNFCDQYFASTWHVIRDPSEYNYSTEVLEAFIDYLCELDA